MADQELAVDEVNVGFDGAETEIEGIEERTRVLVIVVSEAVGQERSAISLTESNEGNKDKIDVRLQASAS